MVIKILRTDKEYDYVFSEYNKKILSDMGHDVYCIDSVSDFEIGDLCINPYLIIQNKDLIDNIDVNCDLLVMYERPVLDITNQYKSHQSPCYNLYMFVVNDVDIKNKMFNVNEYDFYKWCKNKKYKINTVFSNICLKEKMVMFDVCYIPVRDRYFYMEKFKKEMSSDENS